MPNRKISKKLRYPEFIQRVSMECGYPIDDVYNVMRAVLFTIIEVVLEGDAVHVPNFGKFFRVRDAARKGRTPDGRETYTPPRWVFKFRVASFVKGIIREAEE